MLNTVLQSLEPLYQLVQRETKKRIQENGNTPSSLEERYMVGSPIDHCYVGCEQIIEKLQADLKFLANLAFGQQDFYDKFFPNLGGVQLSRDEQIKDRLIIAEHYSNSIARWFFLELAGLLESNIRQVGELLPTPTQSNLQSFISTISKIKEPNIERVIKIAEDNFDNHVSINKVLDQLKTTKDASGVNNNRNFINALLKIRNASHNGFYYGATETAKDIKVLERTFSFIPGRAVDVSILDVKFFLEHSIKLIQQLDIELGK